MSDPTTWVDWVHAVAVGIAFFWAFFSWIGWERIRSQREALTVCHKAMRDYEERLHTVVEGNIRLIGERERLAGLLGEDCEGSP